MNQSPGSSPQDDAPRAPTAPPVLREAADAQSLASSLAPVLIECCGQRLKNIRWFRADWQRGGAATGRAVYTDGTGAAHDAIIKIPVGHTEWIWTQRLQSSAPENVAPRLYAGDNHLAGYDLAWIVIEALPHGPLGAKWSETSIPRIADAAARFYVAARAFEVDRPPKKEDWVHLLHQSRDSVQTNPIPERQRWMTALRTLQHRLPKLEAHWTARAVTGWLHGDLHPANAMCRDAGDAAPVTLIDLAEIHPGHWIEDAIYLERLHWNRPERIQTHKPVREIARAMRAHGLDAGEGYQQLAAVRRAMLAATAPRFMKTEGSPAHLHACLERLEASLHELTGL